MHSPLQFGKMRKIKSSSGNKLQIPRIQVRRSSSLHTSLNLQPIDDSKLSEVSAITPSNSYLSVFSAAQTSSYDFSSSMARCSAMSINSPPPQYRCCFGTCRIRVGACLIGVACILISILLLCSLLSVSTEMTSESQTMLSPPIILSILQFASSMVMIVAVLTSFHLLLIPFIVTCTMNIVGLFVLCSWTVVRRSKFSTRIVSLILAGSTGSCILYVWFIVIIGMTFVLIRDRKLMGYDDDYDVENRTFERASSSVV